MNSLIDTPYGKKTPELLCRAMDALKREPELRAALEALLPLAAAGHRALCAANDPDAAHCADDIANARAAIANSTKTQG